jgi:hypothetical protein
MVRLNPAAYSGKTPAGGRVWGKIWSYGYGISQIIFGPNSVVEPVQAVVLRFFVLPVPATAQN